MEDFESSQLPTTLDRHLQTAIRPDLPLVILEKLTGASGKDIDPDVSATVDLLIRRGTPEKYVSKVRLLDPSRYGKLWTPGLFSETSVIRIIEGMSAAADVASSITKSLSSANVSFTGFSGLEREANCELVSTALAAEMSSFATSQDISRERLDTKELLAKISRKEINSDHFVIGLRTKERELAIRLRCYAVLTLEMRTCFVLTEKNIAESVFPVFDYQTMTSSESQVSWRLMSLETAEQLSLPAHGAAYYRCHFLSRL